MLEIVYNPATGCLEEREAEIEDINPLINYMLKRIEALKYLGLKLDKLESQMGNLTTIEYASFLDDLSVNIAFENSQLESAFKSIKQKLPLSNLRIEQIK